VEAFELVAPLRSDRVRDLNKVHDGRTFFQSSSTLVLINYNILITKSKYMSHREYTHTTVTALSTYKQISISRLGAYCHPTRHSHHMC
jgi:hypothetical protein